MSDEPGKDEAPDFVELLLTDPDAAVRASRQYLAGESGSRLYGSAAAMRARARKSGSMLMLGVAEHLEELADLATRRQEPRPSGEKKNGPRTMKGGSEDPP